jgi:hypothetical protein
METIICKNMVMVMALTWPKIAKNAGLIPALLCAA